MSAPALPDARSIVAPAAGEPKVRSLGLLDRKPANQGFFATHV
jgi:hypothetical protein